MTFKKIQLWLAVAVTCISACQTQTGTLEVVPINMHENSQVRLSEIAGEIKKVSLELTDESLIAFIQRVIYNGDRLYILESKTQKVLVFDSQGKYVRQIGSRGQGPGEYVGINDIAYNDSENTIAIASSLKIGCYNVDGRFLHECQAHYAECIYFHDGYLNIFSSKLGVPVENGFLNQTTLYRMDNKCNVTDSTIVKSILLDKIVGTTFPLRDYVSQVNSQTFVYYPVLTPEPIVRDTLYELKENTMIPFLKLRFSDDGATSSTGNKTKSLTNIWRSERFIFAHYQNKDGNFCFMHDLKTGRNANMKDGLVDDIHHTGTVNIRPLGDNYFYYIVNPEPPDFNEEPNPDIYIGKFL